ncbi:uncharacterized protein LOC113511313 [Galleria mellonella]|uniref:Uncharacterized protein LOC113511313 n=1 Tax=Galleria mellonella TaxID=7137 RepID=A0ABM3MAD9_GALME|nr:uncharacterized protein LOC113511313 [Galleria mellonella]
MVRITSYVFVDIETTGLPHEELNKTKITEISMVAVQRDHILNTNKGSLPRVQNKLTLCLNPRRMVSPASGEITKLSNELLEYQPSFDLEVHAILNKFLNILPKPVCLIAYNGHNFDFPIIKNQLERLGMKFSDDLYCADCYHGFYDIENPPRIENQPSKGDTIDNGLTEKNLQKVRLVDEEIKEKKIKNHVQTSSDPKCRSNVINGEAMSSNTSKGFSNIYTSDIDVEEFMASIDETDFINGSMNMKLLNESTPKQQIKPATGQKRVMKARRRLPWTEKKPKFSYKLGDLHERVFKETAIDLHCAESDCLTALKIAVAISNKFVQWTEKNCVLFSEVNTMTPGVRIGD